MNSGPTDYLFAFFTEISSSFRNVSPNALGDALTTAVVFLALATELEREQLAKGASGLTLRKLLEISVKNAKG